MYSNIFNRNNFMVTILLLFFASISTAAEVFYKIRADGLACPYCAYGIEKKLMKINGVKHVDINLKKGKVMVTGEAQLDLQDEQLKTLFNDSGFTFRKIISKEIREQ
ncbi:MAG: heavy-metal-associated domain-containing protein, partial [Proteobacteria bacterium]|nr:heavy-metal-associated domain-containing protein [Pseudomonadota bacterium]